MERRTQKRVVASQEFFISVDNIYQYTTKEFGKIQAIKYENLIYEEVTALSSRYNIHPECRYLATKNRMYRNVILPAHFILYRITTVQIEVLDIIPFCFSIKHLKSKRKIHP